MEIKKILWPTDLSGNAEKAQETVRAMAQKHGAEVHLLYVMEDLGRHEPWYGDFNQEHIDKIQAWEREKAEKRLNELCETALKGCPAFFKEIALGDPAEEILKAVGKIGADAVILAAKGRTGRFAFGGVADKVVKNASVPVVTVPVDQSP